MVTTRKSRRGLALGVVLALCLLLAMPTSGFAARSAVIPPQAQPYGRSYGAWSAAWWQWAFATPVHDPPYGDTVLHPLFDETGSRCGVGQSGPVWFLGGVINATGTVERTACTVPTGKALFFPIVNNECSTVENGLADPAALLACNRPFLDSTTGLVASVDGVPLLDLPDAMATPYRVQSPVYDFTLPQDNFLQFFGVDAPAGTCFVSAGGRGCTPYRSVADGVYLMLAPLPPGPHTIHFAGTFTCCGFALDITYRLTVAAR